MAYFVIQVWNPWMLDIRYLRTSLYGFDGTSNLYNISKTVFQDTFTCWKKLQKNCAS